MPPLADVTVLDVTQMVAGPFASMQLADLGADVYKVERPDGGELGRKNPPFIDDRSAYFAAVNRNKESIALDLASDRGREAFLDLAGEADVIVENNPPGRMEKFGIGYETVREHNPGIVYCSITGFGETGPYSDLPALDIVVQALSGVMSMTGPAEGPPQRAGVPIGDIAASMYAVQSVILSLFERRRTGEGEYLEVALLDCLVQWLTVRAGYAWGTDDAYPRMGNSLREFVPYGVWETGDGYLAVVVVADHHWRRLCEVIDRPELATDERFATGAARRQHREAVDDLLRTALASASAEEWFDRLRGRQVPAAPIRDTLEVWEDDHVRTRDLLTSVRDGDHEVPAIRYPVAVGDGTIDRGVPALGGATRDALAEAGFDAADIDTIVDAIDPYTPE